MSIDSPAPLRRVVAALALGAVATPMPPGARP